MVTLRTSNSFLLKGSGEEPLFVLHKRGSAFRPILIRRVSTGFWGRSATCRSFRRHSNARRVMPWFARRGNVARFGEWVWGRRVFSLHGSAGLRPGKKSVVPAG